MEWLCQEAKEDVESTTSKAITPLWDAGIFGSNLMTLEVKEPEKEAVESLRTFQRAIAKSTRLRHLLRARPHGSVHAGHFSDKFFFKTFKF